jgi:hypothetical protein
MRIVDSTPTMSETVKFLMSSANSALCMYRRAVNHGYVEAAFSFD